MILGIDIGGTTTDIVCFDGGSLRGFLTVKADDPVTSASGALGKFISKEKADLKDISVIAVTGVGSTAMGDELFGIPLVKVNEFRAIGKGGEYLSGMRDAVVVSMGTGTAIVKVDGQEVRHLGGTGVGGGTLLGLSRYMLNITDFDTIIEMAERGDLSNIDLSVGDIARMDIGGLPLDITASNFGKYSDKATADDIAMGIVNLVCQTVGLMAIFAARNFGTSTVVLTGKMVGLHLARNIFDRLRKLMQVDFITPRNAAYSTAVGAAYSVKER
jgi:type II pantothenate kinase